MLVATTFQSIVSMQNVTKLKLQNPSPTPNEYQSKSKVVPCLPPSRFSSHFFEIPAGFDLAAIWLGFHALVITFGMWPKSKLCGL